MQAKAIDAFSLDGVAAKIGRQQQSASYDHTTVALYRKCRQLMDDDVDGTASDIALTLHTQARGLVSHPGDWGSEGMWAAPHMMAYLLTGDDLLSRHVRMSPCYTPTRYGPLTAHVPEYRLATPTLVEARVPPPIRAVAPSRRAAYLTAL